MMKKWSLPAIAGVTLLLASAARAEVYPDLGDVVASFEGLYGESSGVAGLFGFEFYSSTLAGDNIVLIDTYRDADTIKDEFEAFCVDVHENVGKQYLYKFDVTTLNQAPIVGDLGTYSMGANKATDLAKLWSVLEQTYPSVSSNDMTTDQAAAAQYAVWEIINETSGNPYAVGTGDWTLGAAYATEANALLSGISAITDPTKLLGALIIDEIWIDDGQGGGYWKEYGGQDMVAIFSVEVPEPSTLGLAGIGLLGLLARRRRS
jgi:hypothetical protein